jgi:hypothetical protein
MTQEEKQLLLADLCTRLPYNLRIRTHYEDDIYGDIILHKISGARVNDLYKIENCKPYLRPMSSMTEEERKKYEGFIIHRDHINAHGQEWDIDCFSFGSVPRLIDWLNAHHFDYRGLIEKGLAIAVDEENNPYKE